jgi:hypothetical protein
MNNFRQRFVKSLSISLGVILTLAAVIAVLGFEIRGKSKAAEKGRGLIADELEALNSYAVLKSERNELQPYFTLLENVLPLRDELIDFKGEMERLARNEGVDFGFSFGGEEAATAAAPGKYTFSITSKGGKDSLLNYIKAIEDSRFLVNFSSVDLFRLDNVFLVTLGGGVFYR